MSTLLSNNDFPATLVNGRNNAVICERASIARSFFARSKGLLGRSTLPADEGLIITGCNSVHMFFMRFPIDVVFCSKEDTVIGLQENLRPWRFSSYWRGASYVVELSVGAIRQADLKVGDLLRLRK